MEHPHDRYNAFVAAAPDAIIAIDTAGTILAFNVAAERMFGYAAAAAIGHNVSMLMPDPYRSKHDSFIQRYLETGENQVIGIGREARALRQDGTLFAMELSVCEILSETDHLFIGIIRDISARKALEASLAEYQRVSIENQLELLRRVDVLERELSECRASPGSSRRSIPTAEHPVRQNVLAGTRILVVDDDRSSCFVARRFLEIAGAEVTTVMSGIEAIDAVGRTLSTATPLSAIVLDLRMPIMDGHRTALELRRMGYSGPLVALTADVFDPERHSSTESAFDRWLTKPTSRLELTIVLRELIPS